MHLCSCLVHLNRKGVHYSKSRVSKWRTSRGRVSTLQVKWSFPDVTQRMWVHFPKVRDTKHNTKQPRTSVYFRTTTPSVTAPVFLLTFFFYTSFTASSSSVGFQPSFSFLSSFLIALWKHRVAVRFTSANSGQLEDQDLSSSVEHLPFCPAWPQANTVLFQMVRRNLCFIQWVHVYGYTGSSCLMGFSFFNLDIFSHTSQITF